MTSFLSNKSAYTLDFNACYDFLSHVIILKNANTINGYFKQTGVVCQITVKYAKNCSRIINGVLIQFSTKNRYIWKIYFLLISRSHSHERHCATLLCSLLLEILNICFLRKELSFLAIRWTEPKSADVFFSLSCLNQYQLIPKTAGKKFLLT